MQTHRQRFVHSSSVSKRNQGKIFHPSATKLTRQSNVKVYSVPFPPPGYRLLCNGLNICHTDAQRVKLHHLRTNSSRISNVIPCFPPIKMYWYAIFIFHSSPPSRQAFFHCFNGATFNFILLSPSN